MTESPSSQHLGNTYILDEQIGSGAQGEVWKGHAKESPQPLAFKILHKSITDESSVIDAFLKERSALKKAAGPNVIEVHDIVVERNTLALVMDYVNGGSLRDLIKSHGAMPPQTVAWLGSQVSAGIAAVHNAGVVHRDIKPENILIDSSTSPGTPKIADFGVASICDSAAATRTATDAGTPLYMAPEVNSGTSPSFAMNVYSLGVILYEMSCGVTPFNGPYNYVTAAHALMVPTRPEGIPDPLWALISKMLDKSPESRPEISAVRETLNGFSTTLSGIPAAPTLSSSPCTPKDSPLSVARNIAPAPQSPEVSKTLATSSLPPPPRPSAPPPYPGQPRMEGDKSWREIAPPPYLGQPGRRAPAPSRPRRSPLAQAAAVVVVGILAVAGGIGVGVLAHTRLHGSDSKASGTRAAGSEQQQPGPAAPQESAEAPAGGGAVTTDGKDAATIEFVESLRQADEVGVWRQTTPQSRQQLEDPAPAPGYQTARDYIAHNASVNYNVGTCMNNADAKAAGIEVTENQVACRIDFSCQASCPAPVVVLEADKVDSISFISH